MSAPEVAAIRATVAAELARHGRRRLDVAFSGGPDSSVLADAAVAHLGASAVRLLHVDHGAAASAAAVAHVRAWAAARGLALAVVAIEVPPGPSWEAQARGARDQALVALAGDELIATGHTASDQAETVLLRLVRGTGPDGLAAIAPRRGPFIRPLLVHPRAAIRAYVDALGLAPWHDPMNDDPAFTRVWLRQQIVPALAARNPQIERALAQLAAQAADDRVALAPAVAAVEAAVVDADDRLGCAPLAAAPAALARRVIAGWLARHGRSYEHAAVVAVLELARAPTAGTRGLDLPGGRVERIYDALVIAGPAAAAPPLRALGPDGPYQIRPWQPGDRMRPARLRGGSRKLSDLYGDLKVARGLRAGARVVIAASGAIAWAEHVGPAWQTTIVVRADLPE
ncbi:MAG: tRNA lysidine(34) synthetase TilS [Myxococcales bacterium]|nr:tRNA lysidine(34) synthetase TilS [Myxococcales bacterium]